jgi:UDP:flavonoid glycosyltransferase YjiC (YdhE family)
VCHGGFGTVLAAVAHGIPLIIVPFGADQHLNAASVVRLGIGVAIDADEMTGPRVRDAVRKVLGDPSYRANARRLQAVANRLPTVRNAIAMLESLVRDPRLGSRSRDG